MRILVTGGSGMVGKHLKEILPDAIYISSKDGDLRDPVFVRWLLSSYTPDVVIHLAAIVGYAACEKNPELTEMVKVQQKEIEELKKQKKI